MRRLIAVLLLTALTGCTSGQIAKWLEWHAQDPAAAEAFAAQPEIQAQLDARAPSIEVRAVWDDLAWCESGGNWSYNGSSGYDGGLQFLPSVWVNYGGREFASHAWGASREQQIVVAERILADVGWGAWPGCSRKLGLR